MLDKYFIRPLFWDYVLGAIITGLFVFLKFKGIITLPKEEYILSIASDLSTIALTLAGFILTLLTVLITFKSSSKVKQDSNQEEFTLFEMFFGSNLYFETVKHLKNCVKSLVFISIFGYTLKLTLNADIYIYLYFFNVFGLAIIMLTLWRSLIILSKIIEMQKEQ